MSRLAISVSPFDSAVRLADAVREGDVSCTRLVQLYLDRIHKYNPALNAVVISNESDALHSAGLLDHDLHRNIVRGPLHGVPVTVKEAFNLAGLKTTVNFTPLRNHVAARDAFIVNKLREAGATILGKTNVPPMLADYQCFGPLYPPANNPHDHAYTPGGSTGGGAAAVAAALTSIEIGSDLGGSIRLPAHFCGVFSLKPTENFAAIGEGHVPPPPNARPGFNAMACIGPMARTMADIELAWNVINQPAGFSVLPAGPIGTSLGACKVAWFDDVEPVICSKDTKRVLHSVLNRLEAAGVPCSKHPFDHKWLNDTFCIWTLLMGAMVAQNSPWLLRQAFRYYFTRAAKGSLFNLTRSWKTGLGLRRKDFCSALQRRSELVQDLHARFAKFDFIISPVAAGPAFRHNPRRRPIQLDGVSVHYLDYVLPFTVPYNACGNPVLVVPAGSDPAGLPIGIQIAAPQHAEHKLIQFGRWLEQLGLACPTPQGC
jgi:amidase